MIPTHTSVPIADLHCDLLSYMARIPNSNWEDPIEIGVALPHLRAGNVCLQVMAVYTATQSGSTQYSQKQVDKWESLLAYPDVYPLMYKEELEKVGKTNALWILPAIENASGLCEEGEALANAWKRLDEMEKRLGRILYIGLTHHTENRFGGGNYSDNIGLKPDGKALLDHLDGRNIAIDLAHTSDQLATDILTYIDTQRLNIPIIASHSNFRSVWNHLRNLPDEIAQEVILKKGLIGINFLRAYVDDFKSNTLLDHFTYGLGLGAEKVLALGADYFYTKDFYDPSRMPLYHKSHSNASCYPQIMGELQNKIKSVEQIQAIGLGNTLSFLSRLWS